MDGANGRVGAPGRSGVPGASGVGGGASTGIPASVASHAARGGGTPNSVLDTAREVVRTSGYRGLYKGFGTVVGGLVTQGIITEGVTMNVGPCEDGTFRPVTITSIKRNRAPCRLVRATQSAALAIDMPVASLRRGMCLVDPRNDEEQARPAYFFQVQVLPSVINRDT